MHQLLVGSSQRRANYHLPSSLCWPPSFCADHHPSVDPPTSRAFSTLMRFRIYCINTTEFLSGSRTEDSILHNKTCKTIHKTCWYQFFSFKFFHYFLMTPFSHVKKRILIVLKCYFVLFVNLWDYWWNILSYFKNDKNVKKTCVEGNLNLKWQKFIISRLPAVRSSNCLSSNCYVHRWKTVSIITNLKTLTDTQ